MLRPIRVLSLLLLFQVCSCSSERFDVDISASSYTVEIQRLDRTVFSIEDTKNADAFADLKRDYHGFLGLYTQDIMQIGPIENEMTPVLLNRFTQEPTWKELRNIINKQYPDLDEQSADFERAFRRYSVLMNERSLPRLVAYNSGFNVGIYPTSAWLGLGLEWYCGSDQPILDRLPPELFPMYKRQKMNPEYLIGNAMKGWFLVKYQDRINEENLLGRMIFAGKIIYLTKVILEYQNEQRILNYRDTQMAWCQQNAFDMWKYFLENDLLFSTDAMQVNKIMNDGPFTPGMPPESPGGVGNWIGYQIVLSYMTECSDVSLRKLMDMKNDRELLKYYKPGR